MLAGVIAAVQKHAARRSSLTAGEAAAPPDAKQQQAGNKPAAASQQSLAGREVGCLPPCTWQPLQYSAACTEAHVTCAGSARACGCGDWPRRGQQRGGHWMTLDKGRVALGFQRVQHREMRNMLT